MHEPLLLKQEKELSIQRQGRSRTTIYRQNNFLRVAAGLIFVSVSVVLLIKITIHDETKSDYTVLVRSRIRGFVNDNTARWHQSPNGNIRPFVHKSSRYMVSKRYNYSIVNVPKVMSTTMYTAKCLIDYTEKFNNISYYMEHLYWRAAECKPSYEMNSAPEVFKHLPDKHPTLQIVRDPLSRFVSAFVHLCIRSPSLYKELPKDNCFGCDDNLECVLNSLYTDFLNISSMDGKNSHYFYDYLDRDFFRVHFYPQTWYGDLADRFEGYDFVRFGSGGEPKFQMVEDLLKFYKNAGVEKEKLPMLETYHKGEFHQEHYTTTFEGPKNVTQRILKSVVLLQKLIQLYYYDFKIFGFDIPTKP